jgi:hypothetical protein
MNLEFVAEGFAAAQMVGILLANADYSTKLLSWCQAYFKIKWSKRAKITHLGEFFTGQRYVEQISSQRRALGRPSETLAVPVWDTTRSILMVTVLKP